MSEEIQKLQEIKAEQRKRLKELSTKIMEILPMETPIMVKSILTTAQYTVYRYIDEMSDSDIENLIGKIETLLQYVRGDVDECIY